VEVVRPAANDATELVSMRWGLVPWWWKKPLKQLPASFNARAETVADKPMFRDAFQRHRCIIPASGYYEWLKRPDGKQPYFISADDGGVLSFAGLWDRWKNHETGEPVILSAITQFDGLVCRAFEGQACGTAMLAWPNFPIPVPGRCRDAGKRNWEFGAWARVLS
jgi:putative SOS response-associated peptidase YedK